MIEVVIPAHNAASFLRETLESVAAQERLPALVTVVNDRSRDATREVALRAAEELAPRLTIRVLENAGPPGPSAARNTAIRTGDQPWVALLDADDVLLPRHHTALMALAGEGISLAFGDCCLFQDGTGEVLLESHHAKSRLLDLPFDPAPGGKALRGSSFAALLRSPHVPTSACLLRRQAVLAAGLFDEAMMYAEDIDLFLRLTWLGNMRFTEERLTRKRVHTENLTREENRIRFSRGGVVIAAKMRMLSHRADLALFRPVPEDFAAVAEMLPRAVNAYLYDASCRGFARYWEASLLARKTGLGIMATRPKHLARLLWYRVLSRA